MKSLKRFRNWVGLLTTVWVFCSATWLDCSVRNLPAFHSWWHRLIIDYLITFSEVFIFALKSYIFNSVHIVWRKNSVRSQFFHAANGNIKKKIIAFHLIEGYSPLCFSFLSSLDISDLIDSEKWKLLSEFWPNQLIIDYNRLSHVMRLWYFFVLRKLILQTRMPSHPVGRDVWFLVGPFVYFHTSCVWTAKAQTFTGCLCHWLHHNLMGWLD